MTAQNRSAIRRKGERLALPLAALVALALSLATLFVGKYDLDLPTVVRILASPVVPMEHDWPASMETVVLQVRVPRMLAALLVGAALSVSGATYQGVFRNPLVAPDLLGVSSGACVGAALGIVTHAGAVSVQLFALAGGLAAVFATLWLSRRFRGSSTVLLVLAGIIVSGFATSALGLIKYTADPDTELAEIVYWQMGSLASVQMDDVVRVLPGMLVAFAVLLALRWRIGLLALGDGQATSLGVDVRRLRLVAILCATVLTASAVCICGAIAWIGLVVPHLCRLLVGPNTERIVPLSLLVGGAFLTLSDILARMLTTAVLPLSVVIGFVGAPLFAWLVWRQGRVVA